MASRTDLLHSYQFRTRRVLAALVMRETDPRQSPLRRGVGAVFAGVMVTILAAAGFGIYGLISKVGGDSWRTPNSVIVERETGASYVYLNDTLYPTLNLASAMLAAGQQNPTVHRVASRSLAQVARGNPIGIAGAPDSLPAADRQIGLPWTVCAGAGSDLSGRRVPRVALAAGVPTTGGDPLRDEALLVRNAELDQTYLIWHGHRHLVRSARSVVPALFRAVTPIDVGTAWLNAVPAGLDIAPLPVDRRGQASRAVPGYRNGDVLLLEVAASQYYVVLDDGLAPLTRLQQAVLDPEALSAAVRVDPSFVGSVPTSATQPDPGEVAPPADIPALRTPGAAELICATTTADPATPSVTVGAVVEGIELATPTPGTSADGTPLADAVLVPGGRVAVVHAVATPGAPGGSYLVVTDMGVAYPVPDAGVLPLLGYSANRAIDIPSYLAALVPVGPTLDPAAARTPAAFTAS